MNKQTKRKYEKIGLKASMYIRVLHQEQGISGPELVKRFPQFSERSIYRHAASTTLDVEDKRKNNKGRPRKLNEREERKIVRTLKRLRKERASFSSKHIQHESKISHVSIKTLTRVLRKNGYRYLQSRKKGLLSEQDRKKRIKAAREAKNYNKDFWRQSIRFYFDGVGFAHKRHPLGEARAASSMAWRKPGEGLQITTKGKKEGSGGNMANFYVAIAYGKGVVLCKHIPWRVTGERFATFIKNVFPGVFKKCEVNPRGSLWLQDGDPRQNSKQAKEAWEKLGCEMFPIPARSPDLNPIENMFNNIRRQLKDDALEQNIDNESYNSFCKRVANTIKNYPSETIDKTIDSMVHRFYMVIKGKGYRTKY